jgi:hypothetical protein
MRAVFLAVILCLSAPPVPLAGSDRPAPDLAGSIAFGSAAPATSHAVRAAAKADKTFGSSSLIAPPRITLHAPDSEPARADLRAGDPRNLSLDTPPLAPRPPPL